MSDHMQIGEVAELTGLSLRTIRHYEQVGLVTPDTRSQGGFRLYTAADVDRLRLIRQMRVLGFDLDEMRDLIALLPPATTGSERAEEQRLTLLHDFSVLTDHRCADLRAKFDAACEFLATLRERRAALVTGATHEDTVEHVESHS